jgi:membrane protease YdiL (CAAX protease family)
MTAVLFGVLHLSIVQGISAAAAGIVLCVFYGRRKSVGLNILAHSIYNGMVFGLAMLLY